MKALNFIDLAVQTLILGLVILSSIAIAFTGNFESIGIVAMYGAVFLGPWQLVSSLITTLSKGLFLKWRITHLLSSIVYLVLISLVAAFDRQIDASDRAVSVAGFFAFAIPSALALFYYYITTRSFQAARAMAKPV